MDPYIGEIRDFGFNFAPRGWLQCDGRLLQISEYTTLFQLIGTTYGGDGQQTFGLPDLRGRAPLHCGHAPDLSNYRMGEIGGEEMTVLKLENVPQHSHPLKASLSVAESNQPANTVLAIEAGGIVPYSTDATAEKKTMHENCITQTGDSQPNENRQPFLVTNFCIAYAGYYPGND